MQLDTQSTIYVCTDRENAQVKLLLPSSVKLEVVELNLSDPDPESTDRAEYQLLATEMTEYSFDV